MTAPRYLNRILLLLCLSLFGSGCTDIGASLDPGIALISGSWVWQRSVGFHTGVVVPPTPDPVILPQAGSTRVVRFTFDGEYSEAANGVTELHARYKLEAEGNYYRVTYSGLTLSNGGVRDRGLLDMLAIVTGDTLRLRDIGPNGSLHTYARLR